MLSVNKRIIARVYRLSAKHTGIHISTKPYTNTWSMSNNGNMYIQVNQCVLTLEPLATYHIHTKRVTTITLQRGVVNGAQFGDSQQDTWFVNRTLQKAIPDLLSFVADKEPLLGGCWSLDHGSWTWAQTPVSRKAL